MARGCGGLTAKQQRFVEEFLVDGNATQAAIRAGYSERTARSIAQENLTRPDIATAIATGQRARSTHLGTTADDIARELVKLGFANMADYLTVGEDGQPTLDWSQLTRDQAAALQEVTVDEYVDGAGDDAREVRFKLGDKRSSLVDLAKLLGFWKERHEVTGRVRLEDVLEVAILWAKRKGHIDPNLSRKP